MPRLDLVVEQYGRLGLFFVSRLLAAFLEVFVSDTEPQHSKHPVVR